MLAATLERTDAFKEGLLLQPPRMLASSLGWCGLAIKGSTKKRILQDVGSFSWSTRPWHALIHAHLHRYELHDLRGSFWKETKCACPLQRISFIIQTAFHHLQWLHSSQTSLGTPWLLSSSQVNRSSTKTFLIVHDCSWSDNNPYNIQHQPTLQVRVRYAALAQKVKEQFVEPADCPSFSHGRRRGMASKKWQTVRRSFNSLVNVSSFIKTVASIMYTLSLLFLLLLATVPRLWNLYRSNI